ncbi:MAG: xylulokinase [Clostridiales bacterium]|nr:xylulokinase [Clostridiales bacterium]
MKEDGLILVFDIGTTGVKCAAFKPDGEKACAHTVNYDTVYPKPGWAEQKPEDYWRGIIDGTKVLLEKGNISPQRISVIGLSGHMNGCIPVDANGDVLYPNIIHSDCRSQAEASYLKRVFDEWHFYSITGNRIDPHYTFTKILWLKKNYPEIYDKTAYFLNSKDYVGFKLTGRLGVTDFSDASLTCMLNINKGKWAEDVLSEAGVDVHKLPELMPSFHVLGGLSKQAADILGLKAGTPVVVGGGDGACATKGAGVVKKGQAYNYIGSSAWISTINDRPVLDKGARIFHFYDLDGRNYNVTGTVQCATIAYDWAIENIGGYELEKVEARDKVFDIIEDLARQAPVGSNGVFFVPYMMGERTPHWDENTRGGFVGLTLYHGKSHLFRSVYEGVAFALKNVLDVFEENGLKVEALTLLGGGAKSRLWNEIMCNVYGKPIRVHSFPGEATSLGAAIAAGVGVGIFESFEDAARIIRYQRFCQPVPSEVQAYQNYYRIYNMMYRQLKPIYDEIARLMGVD